MRAGPLDRRLTLAHKTHGAQAASGDYTITYTTYATVWGKKIELNGRETFVGGAKDAETAVRFEIRYRSDVVATDRVTLDGVVYELTAPPAELGRRRGLALLAKAVINA